MRPLSRGGRGNFQLEFKIPRLQEPSVKDEINVRGNTTDVNLEITRGIVSWLP